MAHLAQKPHGGTATDYAHGWHARTLKGGLDSPARVVPLLMELVKPASVVDFGCGPGPWLAEFRNQGVTDIFGVEGDWLDRSTLQFPEEKLLIHDLSEPLSLPRQFDLVLCLEVGEHLATEAAPTLVNTLTSAGPVVVFSAGIPFQGGTHHVNERWPEYWAGLFEQHGFVGVEGLRLRVWQDEGVAWYYRQNLVMFVERESLPRYPALEADYERFGGQLLSLVHPDRYLRLAQASPVRARENVMRWASARMPRAFDALTSARSRFRAARPRT